jgi:activating signal cointegrator 1
VNYLVLSLSPPYGTLVALRLKKIETRGWQTRYRGPLLIHQTAAPGPKGTPEAALWDLCLSEPFRTALPRASPSRLPRGKIVALVELVDCQMIGVLPDGTPTYMAYDEFPPVLQAVQEPERAFGDYSPGRWAWPLDNVRPLPEPIAARGMPGLWSWEGALGI